MNKCKTRRITETPAVAQGCGKEHRRLFVFMLASTGWGKGLRRIMSCRAEGQVRGSHWSSPCHCPRVRTWSNYISPVGASSSLFSEASDCLMEVVKDL